MNTPVSFKSIFSSIWFIRLVNFILVASILLIIRNRFYMNDEYCLVIYLDKAINTFHNFHVLSNPIGYLTWFMATLSGFDISAFRALQISSSLVAALGAAALVDIGMFWGLNWANAFLFSAPIIFCNAFIRYGTSAYPGPLATGFGLIAINILIRSLDFNIIDKTQPRMLFIAGLWLGLASLMHLAFALVIPVLFIGAFFVIGRTKEDLRKKIFCDLSCLSGLVLILGLAYAVFLPLCLKFFPEQVAYFKPLEGGGGYRESVLVTILKGKSPTWFPVLKDLFTDIKTHGALFISGVHSKNAYLNAFYNLPRILLIILLVWFIIKAFKRHRANRKLFSWALIFLSAAVFEFFSILFLDVSQCRQYVSIGLSVLGPFFIAVLILAFKNQVVKKIPVVIFLISILFYSIFGIEGIVDIVTHDNRPITKLYCNCDVLRPKNVHLPFTADYSSLTPACRATTEYGAFGPSLDFLKAGEKIEK